MMVTELSKEQVIELKESYLAQLDDAGQLEEVTGFDTLYASVLADADGIVPDDVIFDTYADTEFEEDDFFCLSNED